MKKNSVFILYSTALLVILCSAKPLPKLRVVKFQTTMHCEKCANKVVENISFEKGVEDLRTDMSDKSVTVTYNPAKTDTLKLADAIRHLGYKAKVVSDKEVVKK